MNKITLALAAALIGTAAYAQSPSPSASGGSDKGSDKAAQASQPSSSGSSGGSQASSRNEQGASQAQGRSESTSQGATASQSREQTTTRSRTGVNVGVESRETRGVSVRHRVRSVSEEPSVSIRRRRSVTIEDEPTEVRRTVIKRGKSTKKVAVKKRGKSKVVVRGRRPAVAESVSVTRRRGVRRFEVSEPSSVSVSRRTTIHGSARTGVRSNVSVEQGRSTVRQRSETNVTSGQRTGGATERRGSGPETTGAVSGGSKSNAPAQGGSSSTSSGGSGSGSSGSSEKRADPASSSKPGTSQ